MVTLTPIVAHTYSRGFLLYSGLSHDLDNHLAHLRTIEIRDQPSQLVFTRGHWYPMGPGVFSKIVHWGTAFGSDLLNAICTLVSTLLGNNHIPHKPARPPALFCPTPKEQNMGPTMLSRMNDDENFAPGPV